MLRVCPSLGSSHAPCVCLLPARYYGEHICTCHVFASALFFFHYLNERSRLKLAIMGRVRLFCISRSSRAVVDV